MTATSRRFNEFYDNTLQTRLNQELTGAIVTIMQRLHQDDLVDHVLERDPGGWTVVSVPAIETEDRTYELSRVPGDLYRRAVGEVLHPDREPQEVLDQLRRDIGTMNFSAQYQQEPVPAGGNVIRREWLRYCDALPRRFEKVVVSWDTASTLGKASDWSVGMIWGRLGPDFYLLHVVRGLWETAELQRRIEELAVEYRAHATVIENTEQPRAPAVGNAADDPDQAALRQGGPAPGRGAEIRGWSGDPAPGGSLARAVYEGVARLPERTA